MSDDLFTPIFVPDAMREAVSGGAWLAAMLAAESALASAQARVGVIPAEAAAAIRDACDPARFDVDTLAREARGAGNPVVPLVRALPEHAHHGATSQDIVDTAAMLVARWSLDLTLAELGGVSAACASLAGEHRATPMPGRTLMQEALPITFGLKAANWLSTVADATAPLEQIRRSGLAVQLGGPVGRLASVGGPEVLAAFAEELDLAEPVLPWHTNRTRVAALGSALAIAAGALAKVALDVELLAQSEVAEAAESAGDGRGGSSSMPHKRNPIGSVRTRACARRVRAAAGTLVESMEQEHERAAGAWHAEWQALSDALAYTGGAAAAMRDVLDGLEVDPDRMLTNLGNTEAETGAAEALVARALEHYDR